MRRGAMLPSVGWLGIVRRQGRCQEDLGLSEHLREKCVVMGATGNWLLYKFFRRTCWWLCRLEYIRHPSSSSCK